MKWEGIYYPGKNIENHREYLAKANRSGKPVIGILLYSNFIHVPVLQGMSTYQAYEDWETNLRGLDTMSLTSNVYYPEFDGQIITVTIAYCQLIENDIVQKIVHKPIYERINKICRLALNWAKLAIKPNKDKKVAIIFHNMPPRNDMIGCAFSLDSPQSVYLYV